MIQKIISIFIITACVVSADDKTDTVKKMLSDECSTKGNCGYKPTHPDALKGIPIVERKLTRGMNSLPSSADLSKDMPPVQQQDGFKCVAWSTTYYLRTYLEKKARNWNYYHFEGTASTDKLFSPIFVYNQINNGEDGGAAISDALNVLVKKGAALWRYMPAYSGITSDVKPSPEIFKHASKYKAKEFKRIKASDLNSIKAELASGNPLVFGMAVDSGFRSGLMFKPDAEPYDKSSGDPLGGHAMTLVGYDDDKKGPNGAVGAFKIINSWGPDWANEGYGWITYRMFIRAQPEVYALYLNKIEKLEEDYSQEEQDGLRLKIVNPKSAQASSGTYSDRIIVSWTAVPGMTKYVLFKKDLSDQNSTWERAGDAESDHFTDTNIEPDRVYKYKIFTSLAKDGKNLMDNEETAPEVQGYAKSGSSPSAAVPAKVSGLTAEPDFSYDTNSMQMTLVWNKMHNTAKYEIARFSGNKLNIIGSSKENKFIDKSPGNLSEAKYSVRALNSNGSGDWSDAVFIPSYEEEGLIAPSGLKASSNLKDKIELKWNPVKGASYYTVKRTHSKSKEKKEFRVESSLYTDSDTVPGRIYHYSVSAGKGSEKTKYSDNVTGRTVKTQTEKEEKNEFDDFVNSILSIIRGSDSKAQSKFSKMLSLKKEETLAEFLSGNWSGKQWTGGKNSQSFQIKITMDEKKFDAEFIQGKTVRKISGTVIKGADFIEADGFKMQKVFDQTAEVTIHSNKIYPTSLELNFTKD
ncbi:MAG TPA: C1 family peptidase [Leptospiraceae bacterium]|nr:C1 family peptidase [Leptospiraceae bacterium]HNF23020.1 C1 family peptidase [Leptospiraceae bacterium]